MSDVVLKDVQDGVATITLNRPDRLNAWTQELERDYFAALGDPVHVQRFLREAEVFAALAGIVPVPTTRFLDGGGEHLGRPGIVTGLVSIPLRYMHSPVEMVDLRDVEATIALLAAFGSRVKAGVDLSR